ncbi:MAG: PQQ-binding-like beta-propeller repeat protein [Armatimonadetes bacterium]|nr:PQQ-binding-like beta-propeller repeat protein [Armatimonadota bacterium]
MRLGVKLALAAMIVAAPVGAADWPCWRGAAHDDHSAEASGWEQGAWPLQQPTWQASVGAGSSSVVVASDRLYTMGRVRWHKACEAVMCLEADTGHPVWVQAYPAPEYGRRHAGDESLYQGPSATPTLDPQTGLLYTLGIDGDLNCWDTAREGARVWGQNLYDTYDILPRPNVGGGQRDYGYTMAPLLHGEWLLVQVGSSEGTLFAFDRRTGRRLWTSQHKAPAGHCGGMAPMTVEGLPCVAMLTIQELVVVRLDEGHAGETLATHPWATWYANSIAGLAVAGDRVLLTSGYNLSRTECVRVSRAGVSKLWESRTHSKVCTPVVMGDRVYFAWQKLRCLDLATGQLVWEGGSFGDDASVVATADRRLIVFGAMKLALVDSAVQSPAAYHELAATARLGKGPGWPHVVLSEGRLYAKNAAGHIWCYKVAEP